MKRIALIFIGAMTTMAPTVTRATDEALSYEQQTARTIFTNDFVDGREKLEQLKTGRLVMDLGYYNSVVIEPTKKSLARCREVKIPGATIIGVSKPVPFSEAAELADKFEQEFKAALGMKDDKVAKFKNSQPADCLKRYEAFKGKMTQGLSGDKLRIMNEEVLITAVLYAQDPPRFFVGYYGQGKKLLTRPEDFANARIWATTDYGYANTDTLKTDPHWRVHVYHFDGMKLAAETSDRGPGTVAPDSYFQARATDFGAPGATPAAGEPGTPATPPSSDTAHAGLGTVAGLALLGGLGAVGAYTLRTHNAVTSSASTTNLK